MLTLPTPRTMLITGCSTGFGRITALHMAQLGWQVFATVRKETDQGSLRAEAEQLGCQERLRTLLCDITDQEQVARLYTEVSQHITTLDVLLNNAGTAFASPIELLDLEDLRQQFEINVVAHVGVTQTFLPLLKAAKGMIINVSSISGRYATPVVGPYAASKFALEALSDVLRVELAPFGVRVVIIEPGSSTTQIWSTSSQRAATKMDQHRAGPYGPLLERADRIVHHAEKYGFAPELFAQTVVKIVTNPRPRTRYLIPASEGRAVFLRKLLSDRLWDRQIRKIMRW